MSEKRGFVTSNKCRVADERKVGDEHGIYDYDDLMQANLARVFNERDVACRMKANAELYAQEATLFEPIPRPRSCGHQSSGEHTLASLPQTFVFTANCAAVGHHGVGRLRWQMPAHWNGPWP